MNKVYQERLKAKLKELHENNLYNNIRYLQSANDGYIIVDGKRVLNMCSNNYLGFANDPKTKAAAIATVQKYGVGPGAVRSISGSMDLHLQFEQALAKFKGVEDVLLVQSGFQAATALIPTILTKEDVVFTDQLNHACIIDGIRLAKVNKYIYKHNDMADLEEKLKDAQDKFVGKLKVIITDGVFSMDGDIANLPKIVELAKKYGACTYVDDAHGEGVLGSHGKGIVNHFNLEGQVEFELGTLSKAFGIAGGIIGGSKDLIDYLRQRARPFLFSTGVTLPTCGAGLAVVEEMSKSDARVRKLWDNAAYFKKRLRNLKLDIGQTQTPIVPLMTFSEAKAEKMAKRLFEEGVLVTKIIYPTVGKGLARCRFMISATHSKQDLDFCLEKIEMVARELDLIPEGS